MRTNLLYKMEEHNKINCVLSLCVLKPGKTLSLHFIWESYLTTRFYWKSLAFLFIKWCCCKRNDQLIFYSAAIEYNHSAIRCSFTKLPNIFQLFLNKSIVTV